MRPCNPVCACLLPAEIAKIACVNIIAVFAGDIFRSHVVPVSFALLGRAGR